MSRGEKSLKTSSSATELRDLTVTRYNGWQMGLHTLGVCCSTVEAVVGGKMEGGALSSEKVIHPTRKH